VVEFKADTTGIKKLINQFISIGNEGQTFFNILGIKIDQFTQQTFRLLGARSGRPRWRDYSLLTLHPSWKAKNSTYPEYKGKRYNPKLWQHRYGTDNNQSLRYSGNSKLLQASGGFKQSFGILKTTKKSLTYGTNHELAGEIINDRPVLFVTEADRSVIGRMFLTFIKQKIGINT
jgi:hypothetical protein